MPKDDKPGKDKNRSKRVEVRVVVDGTTYEGEIGESDPDDPAPPPAGAKPSDVLDLSNWKLTLPVGKPTEILDLDGYSDEWFFVDGGVVCRCRVDGATTSNSGYPRTELRQMDADKLAVWSTSGRTSLELDVAVTAAPPAKPQVCLAQIHGGDDDILQVLYDGTRKAITWRKFGSTQPKALIDGYTLGTRFTLRIDVTAGNVDLSINGKPVDGFNVQDDSCYWKAGCYVQSNPSKGDKPEAEGAVVIYRLSLDAKLDPKPVPTPDPAPAPTPTPTPAPGSVTRGNPLDAIRDAAPGAVLDFGHERWEQPAGSSVLLTDRTDLTIARAYWVGPTLAPSEPSIWAQGGGKLRIVDSVIVGSPEVGKWTRELGNKQHGIMAGGTKGLTVLGTVLAHVGGDFVCATDKPTKAPCEDVLLEDVICIYSRRQAIAPSGVRRMTVRRAIVTLTQRTVFDFESEGGGAHDFTAEDCHIDAGTRAPNFVLGIGGADRAGAVNEGPFTFRRCKVYGGPLTISNRSTARVIEEGNEDDLPMSQFPKLAPLLAQRYPAIQDLAALLGVADR